VADKYAHKKPYKEKVLPNKKLRQCFSVSGASKAAYPNITVANEYAEKYGLRAYLCPVCRKYHLTKKGVSCD
jgi:hypothetical protein